MSTVSLENFSFKVHIQETSRGPVEDVFASIICFQNLQCNFWYSVNVTKDWYISSESSAVISFSTWLAVLFVFKLQRLTPTFHLEVKLQVESHTFPNLTENHVFVAFFFFKTAVALWAHVFKNSQKTQSLMLSLWILRCVCVSMFEPLRNVNHWHIA